MKRNRAVTRAALVILGCLILGACGPKGVWSKAGASQSDLRRDQKSCLREAGQYGFLDRSESGVPCGAGRGRATGVGSGDLYRMCMHAQGYGKAPAPKDEE